MGKDMHRYYSYVLVLVVVTIDINTSTRWVSEYEFGRKTRLSCLKLDLPIFAFSQLHSAVKISCCSNPSRLS